MGGNLEALRLTHKQRKSHTDTQGHADDTSVEEKQANVIFPLVPTVPHVPPLSLVGQGFEVQKAKMVLGHNLHHMAPFGILEAAFCMFFRLASF